jgi:hypothetical protein
MPKAVVATLEEVPQALRSEYEPRDGKFVLKVEGDLPGYVAEGVVAQQRTKLDEMRENNRTLMSSAPTPSRPRSSAPSCTVTSRPSS